MIGGRAAHWAREVGFTLYLFEFTKFVILGRTFERMARKRKVDQEVTKSRGRGRRPDDPDNETEPAEQPNDAALPEDEVEIDIEALDDNVGNARRENWAALARRCSFPACALCPCSVLCDLIHCLLGPAECVY